MLLSNVPTKKEELDNQQQKNMRQLLRLRPHSTPSTRNLKYDTITINTNIMINTQVVRGNNYSIPMFVSQNDKVSTDKKRFMFQKRMSQLDHAKQKVNFSLCFFIHVLIQIILNIVH